MLRISARVLALLGLAMLLVQQPELARARRAAPPAASAFDLDPSHTLSDAQRARLAAIPDEHTPDPGEHYPVSNEWRHDLWQPSIQDIGGIYVGVGADQGYTLAAMQNASLALLVDFDPVVPLVHRMYSVLIPASDSPAALAARFSTAQARETRAMIETGLAGDPQLPAILRLFDRTRARWARYMGAVMRSRYGSTWLGDATLYARVRTLFQNGRIVARNGDVTAATTLRDIGRVSQEFGVPVRVIYFSNAEQFFPYTPDFTLNMQGMNTDARTVVLRTFRHRSATYPAGDRWHYVVEPFTGFRERLEGGLRHSRNLVSEIVRMRGGTVGLTVLER